MGNPPSVYNKELSLLDRTIQCNQNLKTITFKDCRWSQEEAHEFYKWIRSERQITSIVFDNCVMDDLCSMAITSAIEISENFIHLAFVNRQPKLETRLLEMLGSVIENNQTLTSLNLSNNGLKFKDVESLVDCLGRNNMLKKLNLSGNILSRKEIFEVKKNLKEEVDLQID
eukprot:TRINITY_DN15031_c0_g2_i8.p1 TRINITY_DN15031_c0_g2~~TRINITY_DN15031_c0_g2_i8.p1  ORF type:complete len:171 (-),score=39.52 TRINITY_DN15031_c0_g2_i8:99-611(-)